MKVLTQLMPVIDGKRVEGRKVWIGKDSSGDLTAMSIYTTKDTADTLNRDDLLKLNSLQTNGSLKVIEIYKR